MKKKELNNCFETLAPTDKQKDKMLLEIITSKGSVTMKKSKKTLSLVVVAAAICVLTASMTLAATTLNWDDKLLELLNPTNNQIEELSSSLKNPQVKVTDNGVTVELKQTIGDESGIYILYDVEIPENVFFKEGYSFQNEKLTLGDGNESFSYSGSILEESDHKRTYLCYVESSESLQGKKIIMDLQNIGYLMEGEPDTEWEFATVIKGKWNLEWIIQNTAEFKTINLQKEIQSKNGSVTVKSITMSPFSIRIDLLGDMGVDDIKYKINLKDGSVIDNKSAEYKGGISSSWKNGETIIKSELGKVIDLNSIMSVELNGETIPF